jgi:tetratricopeptide (TPR) repeat protein
MRECPQCGNSYPDSFDFCPADGVSIGDRESVEKQPPRQPAQIRIKTLMIGFLVLVLCAVMAFSAAYLYLYYKPKYGVVTVKTTPPGAYIYIDDKLRGASPITLPDLRSGAHQIKGTKEGYKDLVQQVTIKPNAAENLHLKLEPIVPQLSNEQLAAVDDWRVKLDRAQKENMLLPPPDDYNVLFFAEKILAIDPANGYALEVKAKMADAFRRSAELAYAREDWLESEKQYRNLQLLFPNDSSVEELLRDLAAKLEESVKDRDKQIQDWKTRAEAAMKAGNLLPPDRDNALEAIRSIQRLDRNNSYVREGFARLKELLQTRGDTKMAASDLQGARNEFRRLLEIFPEDTYSKGRLAAVEGKISELALLDQQRAQRNSEEPPSSREKAALRQTALTLYRSGSYQDSISEWEKYLKSVPNSDEAYFYTGASYQNLKQLPKAILSFEECLKYNPNNILAHVNLGILYDYHRNDLAKAEEHLRKAKDLGGAENYSVKELQKRIEDIQDRIQANAVLKTPFAVEHKHTFSSCRGNILLTEEGIEFKTAETDHSFYEPFKGLREFDLKGSELSIRARNNKRYNFHFLNAAAAERVRIWKSTSGLVPSGRAD